MNDKHVHLDDYGNFSRKGMGILSVDFCQPPLPYDGNQWWINTPLKTNMDTPT